MARNFLVHTDPPTEENGSEFSEVHASFENLGIQAPLLNVIEEAIIVTDLKGLVGFWNRFAEKLYGWSLSEVIGRDVIGLLSPTMSTADASEIMEQLRRGRSWEGEFVVRRKDGAEFPVEITDSPLYDGEGKLVGIIGVSRDISERKRADDVLRTSVNKYRTLVEQASDGIHTYDAKGNFLTTNSKLCEMLGYSREELLGLNVKDLVPAEDLAAHPIRFEALIAEEALLKERRLRRKDGTVFHAEISGKIIQDNVIQGIVRDVSDRKKAEEEIRRSEERFRTILEASHDGILVEENGLIIFVNRSYLTLFDYDNAEALIGENVSKLIAPEDVERVTGYGNSRFRGDLAPTKYEFRGKKRDGRLIDVEASVSVGEASGLTYITTFIRDISDRKRLETLMQVQKETLEMVVAGESLDKVLNYLARSVERQAGGSAVASILLMDQHGCLHNGASPSLPQSYVEAIDGLKADVNVGTFSAAAASGEVVITPDIAGDPRWRGLEHLPLGLGLFAAWTMPIISRNGKVLGTFGTYFRERRRPTYFEQQVVAILARTAALAIEQKVAEESVRNSEYQLRLIADAIPLLVSFVDTEQRYRFVNRAYTEWFGRPRQDVIGKHLSEVLGADAYGSLLPEIARALSGDEVIFERVVPYSTGSRFIHVNYIPEFDKVSGEVIGFHAFVQDISAHKRAEEALHRLNSDLEERVRARTDELEVATTERVTILHKLVRAQEEERHRIARDLHDQLGQQIVVLRLKLASLQKTCDPLGDTYGRIDEIRQLARQFDSDIDLLAYQIRPAALDDLGLVAALEQFIGRWSAHVGIACTFDADRFGAVRLDPECETTFFRITQEALNNIYKHSGASNVNIFLEYKKEDAVLIIEDDGVGFAPGDEATVRRGIGLTGMRERLGLIDGKLEIESGRGSGTTIYASVPLRTGEGDRG